MNSARFIVAALVYTPVDVQQLIWKLSSTKRYGRGVIGYARVSIIEQTLDLQRDALQAAGAHCLYEDHASGKTADRHALVNCLKALRDGDALVVWRLDRMGRNLKDLVHIVTDIAARGVKFSSVPESIDTSGPTGTLVFHMFAALAQFERELVRERTLAGLAAPRARSGKGGRPQLLNANKQRMALSMLKNRDMSVAVIAEHLGVSRSTLTTCRRAAARS